MTSKYDYNTLLTSFKNGTPTIKFIKQNGNTRVLRGTLMRELLPEAEGGTSVVQKSKAELTVYDLVKQGWRQFRVDSVLEMDA